MYQGSLIRGSTFLDLAHSYYHRVMLGFRPVMINQIAAQLCSIMIKELIMQVTATRRRSIDAYRFQRPGVAPARANCRIVRMPQSPIRLRNNPERQQVPRPSRCL